jgi:phage-related baseplate assembly protein
MLLTDAVNIKDAFIVNVAMKYEIITLPNFVSRDVLLACNTALIDYFEISKWSINQPINISSIYTLLDRVKGVQSVEKIYFENKVGDNYSEYAYDIKGATRGNMIYPSYDPCIFEIKFPEIDIQGRVTTL